MEKELLRIARESPDRFGTPITVTLPVENSPLATAVSGKDKVTVLTKLSPAMIGKPVRDELSPSGFTKREENHNWARRASVKKFDATKPYARSG